MISNKQLQKEFDEILAIMVDIDNKNNLFLFLRDLLSENEILEFIKRFKVAKMLDDWISYSEIEQKTWMSSTTIARVSKFLNGGNNWYKNAIKKLKAVSSRHHEGHSS